MAKTLILLSLLLAGCATTEAPPTGPPQVEYSALGQEPGWTLRMDRERIIYAGDGGRTRIAVARPIAEATASGRRFSTGRLVVEILPAACRDAISASGFPDAVIVTTGSRTVRGCGGERLVERRD